MSEENKALEETTKEPTALEGLQSRWKFKHTVEEKPGGFEVHFLDFEDGRKYKFQVPDFFTIHDTVKRSTSINSAALEIGIKNLFVMNETSPKIDDEYLRKRKNREEGFLLWSEFFMEVLFRGDLDAADA